MQPPFGVVFTDPYGPWDRHWEYLDVLRPRANLTIGSNQHVWALCDAYPEAVTVARRWGKEDDNRHRMKGETAIGWVQGMHNWLGGDRRPLLFWDNEPTYNGLEDTEEAQFDDDKLLIRRTLEVYKAAADEGYRVIGPNWAVGWPLQPAQFTEIYDAAVFYGHLIGVHLYGLVTLNDSRTLDWFVSKSDEIAGLCPEIEIGITEIATADYFPDLDPRSRPMRVSEFSQRDCALDAWTFAVETLPERPWLKWGTWFGWGRNWPDYDMSTADEFRSTMLTMDWTPAEPLPEEPMPTLPDGYTPAAVSSTDLAGTRVRKGPGLTEIVGLLNFAPMSGGYDPIGIVANGYTWVHIWTPLIEGWCAKQYVKLDMGGQGEDCAELRQQLATATEQRDVLQLKWNSVRALVCEDLIR